jgi:hypothetical protein
MNKQTKYKKLRVKERNKENKTKEHKYKNMQITERNKQNIWT